MITILLSFMKKCLRKTLFIIDGKKSIEHHKNSIQTLSEKYSKVSYSDFTGKLELNLEKSRNSHHKVILLSALRERPEDIQLQLYKDLERLWKKNLVIFYVKLSKGGDFYIPNCEATQVNLNLQEYSNHKIKENIETLFETSFLEEFRGTISFCLGLLLICVLILSQINIEQPTKEIDPAKAFFSLYDPRILGQKNMLLEILKKADNSQALVNEIFEDIDRFLQETSQKLITISLNKNQVPKDLSLAKLRKQKKENAKLKREVEDLKSRTLLDHLKQAFRSLVS